MAVMRPLMPAVEEVLPPKNWRLIAVDAGRYAKGLQATVQTWNSELVLTALLCLADPESWEDYIQAAATKAACKGDDVRAALMALTGAIEGRLRDQAQGAEERGERQSQATLLVALAADAELWHTPGADGEAWATIKVDGHCEHWPLRVKRVRRWMAERYHAEYETSPSSQAVQDALTVLEGKALFRGKEHPVYTRLAGHDGRIYLDLGDEAWRAVEITSTGWQVMTNPPVKFRRARGMLRLPMPVSGGTLDDLRRLANISSDGDWKLLVGWLIAAVRPTGPYPALALHGEQGSAKSTNARLLRALVDPSTAPLRAEPRDARDLMIAGTNGWVIALDNLSHIQPWLSDALCRLATGGGFATRELYSDNEEMIFDAQRPVVLTGIEELATRGDLLDRAIIIYLPAIAEDARKPEAEVWRDFEAKRPAILGALLDAASTALVNVGSVKLPRLPRMADFAIWVTAAEPALGWESGAFLEAYNSNREQANELALDAAVIVPPLRELLAAKDGHWQGTATELLHDLDAQAPERTRKAQGWPTNGRALSNALRRVAPNLRQAGIEITFPKGHTKGRIFRIQE
jgi:hypothetical protein